MFKPQNHYKRPSDITRPSQNFDNFFGGGYHPTGQPNTLPRHEIVNNPQQEEIHRLNKLLLERDDEISKLRSKNEMLQDELIKAQEQLAKGQVLKTTGPFGFPSPHPPYGISYERYPLHGSEAAKELNRATLQRQKSVDNDFLIAKALQEETDHELALEMAQQEDASKSSSPAFPTFANRNGSLNSSPHLRFGQVRNNRPSRGFARQQQNFPLQIFGHHGQLNDREESNEYEELLALQEDMGHVEIGLTHEQINRLPYTIKTPTSPAEYKSCAICIDDYKDGNKIVSLPCRHHFDKDCITIWLNKHKSCPVCKVEVPQ